MEHALAKLVNFLIIPLFAFANTNVTLESEMIYGLTSNLGLGITLGLLLGKPIGILLVSFICSNLKISSLLYGATWAHILGVSLLAGIGFTMSIFIAILSFDSPLYIAEAKLSILITSLAAGLAGYFVLRMNK